VIRCNRGAVLTAPVKHRAAPPEQGCLSPVERSS
jgi:hypothetical protein